MEHKLIEGGGEQYLPLARSEIKRLRATGQSYATKRLVLPDATVLVSIQPGIDLIHIKGGGATLPMDSGVVDVLNIAPGNVSTFAPGILHETTYAAGYNAGFILPESGNPPRVKSGAGSSGQFSGILSYSGSKFTGRVPVNAQPAKSFAPAKISDGGDPPAQIDSPDDSVLATKKRTAILCPASMFTGRCRLYAQALYGAHLAKGASRDIPFELIEGQRPALWLDNRSSGHARVMLSTGCGVYLDPTNGKHWLFTFTSGGKAYPLKAGAEVEQLRKRLVVSADNTLSEEDREHLEAYILSQSLPSGDGTDGDGAPRLTGSASNPYSMGYSWHWNWDGTRAVAVVNTQYAQDATNSGMTSTMLQVDVTQAADAKGYFTVVETAGIPEYWSVIRTLWTIAEPEWGSYTLVKSTPKRSLVAVGGATFYSFYKRNERIDCAVRVTNENAQSASVTFTNGATGGPQGDNCYTTGIKEGARIQVGAVNAQLVARFTIGDYSTPLLSSGWTRSRWTLEARNKQFGVWGTGYNISSDEHYYGPTFPVSEDDGSNYYTTVAPGYIYVNDAIRYCQFDNVSTTGTESEYGQATVVIPFYDAQAAYVQASTENTKTVQTQSSTVRYHGGGASGGPGFLKRNAIAVNHSDPPSAYIYYYHATTMGSGPSDGHFSGAISYDIDPPEITWSGEEKIVCTAGTIDATFQNLGVFHDNAEENISSGFNTVSGTKPEPDGVAIAPTYIATQGAPDTNAPVLVGWV